MKFGPLKVEKALGAILAHSAGGLKKGRVLSGDDIVQLTEQGRRNHRGALDQG